MYIHNIGIGTKGAGCATGVYCFMKWPAAIIAKFYWIL